MPANLHIFLFCLLLMCHRSSYTSTKTVRRRWGDCNSCWAFAAVGVLESYHVLQDNRQLTGFSEQVSSSIQHWSQCSHYHIILVWIILSTVQAEQIGHISIGVINSFIETLQWCFYTRQPNSEWLFITQLWVFRTDWLILDNNGNVIQNINMLS